MNKDEEWLLNEKYLGERTEDFFNDCKRLESGEPLAYVIGHIPFLNTKIYLDSHPLIPRTETEFWVEKVIEEIRTGPTCAKILDLCAGSGCIGTAVLKEIPQASVDFAEIDTGHHATVVKNILENDIDPARTHIFGGSLFENSTEQYDYILSNPPYIDPKIDRAEESVKKYEPDIALYGGDNGTELIFTIITKARKFLKEKGVLVIEHEPEQTEVIRAYAEEQGFDVDSRTDQFGVERYTHFSPK